MATYMKPNFDGYVTQEGHEQWIELLSWTLETANDSQNLSQDLAGEVKADEISATMLTDASVPSMITKMIAGEIIPLILIEDCNPNGNHAVQRRLKLKNARVKSCKSVQQKSGNETAFRIIFEQMKFEVAAPRNAGMQETAWNSLKKKSQFDE